MKSEQFAYWLQGFAELTPGQVPSKDQWEMIVEHLAEVFDKVTPPMKMGSGIRDPQFGAWGSSGSSGVAYAGMPPSAMVTTALLSTETTARASADTALSSRIGSLQSQGTFDINQPALTC